MPKTKFYKSNLFKSKIVIQICVWAKSNCENKEKNDTRKSNFSYHSKKQKKVAI